MKNIKELSLLIICLTISACVDAQFRKTVYGNGKVVSEERTPVQVTGVKVSTGIDVYLTQGDKLNLVVEADLLKSFGYEPKKAKDGEPKRVAKPAKAAATAGAADTAA